MDKDKFMKVMGKIEKKLDVTFTTDIKEYLLSQKGGSLEFIKFVLKTTVSEYKRTPQVKGYLVIGNDGFGNLFLVTGDSSRVYTFNHETKEITALSGYPNLDEY